MPYQVSRKVAGLSKLYQRGKTQVPSDIRKLLSLNDGDKILWVIEEGKVVVEHA